MIHKQSQRGAVSIFIVMFTALLVTIVTASFIQIMLRNQQQASNNDLSQSAYDSAFAGVEDAKRALVALKDCDKNPLPSCANLRTTLVNNGQNCEVLAEPTVGAATFNSNGESQVGQASMNQAYTCVKVQVITDSYEGTLEKDQSVVIPLETVDDPNDISGVRISWFMQNNIPQVDALGNPIPQIPTYPTQPQLPDTSNWSVTSPSMMRTQLIQFNDGNLKLDSFDVANNDNAKTLFLYPAVFGAANLDFASDGRLSPSSRNYPAVSRCDTAFSLNGGYACSTDVAIPALAGGGTRKAYLQLTSLYNKSTYKVQILGGSGNVINYDNVQPIVDSTGRASDLFRRIRARVAIGTMPSTYPDAALHLGKSLCKDFFITNNPADYDGNADQAVDCDESR